MKQTSLFSFINKSSQKSNDSKNDLKNIKENNIYPYFYLQWSDKKPKVQAHFLNEKPKLCNFKKSFIWKDIGCEIILCGHFDHLRDVDVNDPDTYSYLYKLDKEKKYKNIGYLKSLLQKAIRRKDANIAVKCAFHYMTLDIQDFLRRLPIIMIEDTSIHEVFPTIVWLMIASTMNEFKFDRVIYEYLMGVVYVMAHIPIYHSLTNKRSEILNLKNMLYEANKRDLMIQSFVYTLLLRKAYGGMKCDMNMLEDYAFYWNQLESNKSEYIMNQPIRPIMLASIQTLQLSEWIKEAIDFHCAPHIISYIMEEYSEYNEEYIQQLIWHYSSKTNARMKELIEKKYKREDWEKIKSYVKRVQYYLLEENY
jgi:hypothetical protein